MKKLTEESVHFIRRCLFLGMMPTKISKKFHVQAHVVFDIDAERSYQDIPVLPIVITPDDVRVTGRLDKIFPWKLHGADRAAGLGVDSLSGKVTWLKDHRMTKAERSSELRDREHLY